MSKQDTDVAAKTAEQDEAWSPKVGKPVTVFVMKGGPAVARCKGVCTKVHEKGDLIDAKVTMPNGNELELSGLGPAALNRFGAGYAKA